MVKNMKAALQVKHLTYSDEICFNNVVKFRELLNNAVKQNQSSSPKISYMPIMIKAVSMALKKYPSLNSTVNEDCTEMTMHYNHNIGIAMDTPKGLIVPVINRVQDMSVFEIASELTNLQVSCQRIVSMTLFYHFIYTECRYEGNANGKAITGRDIHAFEYR
jgi:2-oxoisovalerate dehydrogenase E2 component (dihydrolipoyl transacylase)